MTTPLIRGALVAVLLAAPHAGAQDLTPNPWRGRIAGYQAALPDASRPSRVALVNISPNALRMDDHNWRALAARFNALQIEMPLKHGRNDESAGKILDALADASRQLPQRPELKNLGVVLLGFSVGAAAATGAATSRLLSNPDPAQAPQRTIAVVGVHELDDAPYGPPLATPHLFLSDPGDYWGGLLTDVEHRRPPQPHDSFARERAAAGAPITVASQPGHWHGGSRYGYRNGIDLGFLRVWLEETLAARLPPEPPLDAPEKAPDWRFHAGWLGAYDVATKTGAPPWGEDERMIDVAIAPRAEFKDPRSFVWLPGARAAEIWRSYAETGTMPPGEAERPLRALDAFIRPAADPLDGRRDVRLPSFAAAAGAVPAFAALRCSLAAMWAAWVGGAVLIAFDRAITGGEAEVEGPAQADGAPQIWGNMLIVRLKRGAGIGPLKISLRKVAPADGGAPIDLISPAACR